MTELSSEHSESQWEYYGTSDYDYSHTSERFEILESTINSKFNIY